MDVKVLLVTNMYPYEGNPYYGCFVKESADVLRDLGVNIDVLFINGKKSRLNYLTGIWRFIHKIMTNNYNIIHAHYVFSGIIARFQWKYPIVLTHHGIEVLMGYQSILSRAITPFIDKIIVRSIEMKDALKREDAYIIPAGIDMTLFQPTDKNDARTTLGLPVEKKLVLFAGAIRPEKRLDLIKKAVEIVRKHNDSVELVIACNETHDRIPVYMNACDVLVLASKAEGSPNVVKEAMACNLPVVSVNVGDVKNIFGNTDGCYVCDGTAEDIARALGKAIALEGRTRGRERIVSMGLDSRSVALQICKVYEDAIKNIR